VPAKVRHHHLVDTVLAVHLEPLGGGLVQDIEDEPNLYRISK
jgi:hypothetical protein